MIGECRFTMIVAQHPVKLTLEICPWGEFLDLPAERQRALVGALVEELQRAWPACDPEGS